MHNELLKAIGQASLALSIHGIFMRAYGRDFKRARRILAHGPY